MKKTIALLSLLSLTACANLTAQQRSDLQLQLDVLKSVLKVGEVAVKYSATQYCIWEPTISTLVGIFDERSGTRTRIDKVDRATVVGCAALIKNGATPAAVGG